MPYTFNPFSGNWDYYQAGAAGGGGTIGSSVTGGNPNSVLFVDASGNLGQSTTFTYVPTSLFSIDVATAITSTSNISLVVGPNGATNPVFAVDSSITSQATGLIVRGNAAASTVSLTVTSTGTNEGFQINTKGSGSIFLQCGGTTRATFGTGQWLFSLLTAGAGTSPRFNVLNSADLAMGASTEAPFVNFNMANAARQHATGALTLQRDFIVSGTTHTFVGASTVTDLAAAAIVYGDATTNATVTNIHALYIPTKALAGAAITNSYAATVTAATGATNNYAAQFLGGPTKMQGAQPNYTAVATTYSVLTTDDIIAADGTGGVFNVTLPTPSAANTGKTYTVIRVNGSINNITIVGTINGASNLVLTTQYAKATVQSNGSTYYQIG